jgi:hypothetical protein
MLRLLEELKRRVTQALHDNAEAAARLVNEATPWTVRSPSRQRNGHGHVVEPWNPQK